jgi:hypothetical protein
MAHLPPDLSRIGDELAAAAARSLRARHRRAIVARLAATVVACALIFAALTPARLGPAQGGPTVAAPLLASTAGVGSPAVCDQPVGARVGAPACLTPVRTRPVPAVPHRPVLMRE